MGCVVCGKSLIGKKKGTLYCGPSCRSNAHQKRKRAENKAESGKKDMFIVRDINRIKEVSEDSADIIRKIEVLYGKKAAILAIDAVVFVIEPS